MKSLAEFFSEGNSQSWRDRVIESKNGQVVAGLHPEVSATANRGLEVFPVPEFARFSGQPELLIGEATSDLGRLEELAAEYPGCTWRLAIGPAMFILRMDAPAARFSLAGLNKDQEDCSTLCARRAETIWALFRWPQRMVLRSEARKLAPGLRILADGDSCPVPPSDGCTWVDVSADIEAAPSWLREAAFECPTLPPGKALPTQAKSAPPAPCRSRARFQQTRGGARRGYPGCNQAGFRGGYCVSRRR